MRWCDKNSVLCLGDRYPVLAIKLGYFQITGKVNGIWAVELKYRQKIISTVPQSSDIYSPPPSVPGGGSFLIGAFRGHFSCSGFCLAVKVSLTYHSINYQPLMVCNETKWGNFRQICLNCIAALNLIADVMQLIDWLINRKQNVDSSTTCFMTLNPYLLLISVTTNLLINPLFFHYRRAKN